MRRVSLLTIELATAGRLATLFLSSIEPGSPWLSCPLMGMNWIALPRYRYAPAHFWLSRSAEKHPATGRSCEGVCSNLGVVLTIEATANHPADRTIRPHRPFSAIMIHSRTSIGHLLREFFSTGRPSPTPCPVSSFGCLYTSSSGGEACIGSQWFDLSEENGFWMQWLEGGQTEVKTDGAPRLSGRGM
jgi:hypothetical protein